MPDVPLHLSPAIAARVRAAAERQAAERLARAPSLAPAATAQAAVKDESSPQFPPASAPANLNAGVDATPSDPLREPSGTKAPSASALDEKALARLLREARELNDLEEAEVHEASEKSQEELRNATLWLPDQGAIRDLGLTELEVAEAEAVVMQLNGQANHTDDPLGQFTTYGSGWGTYESREVLALNRLAQVVRDLRQVDSELAQSVKATEQRLTRAQELHTGLIQVAEGINQRQAFLARKQAPALDAEAQRTRLKKLIASAEQENGVLLEGVVTVTTNMFAQNEPRLRVQLQMLLEALMNYAFEQPTNPYLTVSGTRQLEEQYPKSLVLFLQRAGIAVPHPRDARRVRLARFV